MQQNKIWLFSKLHLRKFGLVPLSTEVPQCSITASTRQDHGETVEESQTERATCNLTGKKALRNITFNSVGSKHGSTNSPSFRPSAPMQLLRDASPMSSISTLPETKLPSLLQHMPPLLFWTQALQCPQQLLPPSPAPSRHRVLSSHLDYPPASDACVPTRCARRYMQLLLMTLRCQVNVVKHESVCGPPCNRSTILAEMVTY